tara:strand:+ start:13144 stop:14250 length:1107 start_codon:yes stop_codon:yes gene_type:complete
LSLTRNLISRRDFLTAAGVSFIASLAPAQASQINRSEALFAAAYRDRSGGYGFALMAEDGRIVMQHALPVRGHDIVCHRETGNAVVFSRRPGTIAAAFNVRENRPPQSIQAAPDRHYFGHGVFSADGRLLYATENDFANANGMIGVYDVRHHFSKIGEFPSGGIGPHDLMMLADGRTLAIANGGIETHPDFGRAKLNLATMEPCLCFVDSVHGTLTEKQALPPSLHQLSIRHLDCDGAGGVYFACQHEGSPREQPPLFGHAQPGKSVRLFQTDPAHLKTLRNYVGSITANPQNGTFAVTSPRGNTMMVLDGQSGNIVHQRSLANVCGLTVNRGHFVASTGNGTLFDAQTEASSTGPYGWDNHLLNISG